MTVAVYLGRGGNAPIVAIRLKRSGSATLAAPTCKFLMHMIVQFRNDVYDQDQQLVEATADEAIRRTIFIVKENFLIGIVHVHRV